MRSLVPRLITATLVGILSCSTVLADTAHLTATDAVLASDDFEDGNSLPWLTFAPGWVESDGVFHATNTAANTPVSAVWEQGFTWSDVVVEAEVTPLSFTSPSETGIVFRFQEPYPANRYCQCSLFHAPSTVRLVCGAGALNSIAIDYPVSAGNTYLLRASAIGSEVSCEIVGEPATRITANAPGLWATGTAGLRSTHIRSDYDNFFVTDDRPDPQDQVLFDDFKYDCIQGCGSRELFGKNSWSGTKASFLQHFWNDDSATGERVILDGSQDGILTLRLPQGFSEPGAGASATPRIRSPISYNRGVYAARILFDVSTTADQVVQAFWAQSASSESGDNLYAEVDFEYYSDRQELFNVTWEIGCDVPGARESDSDPFANRGWIGLVMRLRPDESVQFEVFEAETGQLLTSHTFVEDIPETRSRLGMLLNLWLHRDIQDPPPPTAMQHEMQIDWVMHHAGSPSLSWQEIVSLVDTMRDSSIERFDSFPDIFLNGFETGDTRHWTNSSASFPCPN